MEKLMALYNISSPSGKEGKIAGFIIGELRRMGIPFRQDRYGNIYAVKGNRESYPCVVAHMDEVHRRKTGSYAAHLVADSMIVGYDHKRKRMTGIGADDKNGIWICLKLPGGFQGGEMRLLRTGGGRRHRQRPCRYVLLFRLPFRHPV